MTPVQTSRISAVQPLWAVEGGRVTIAGDGFMRQAEFPEVRLGGVAARLASASQHTLTAIVPAGLDGGRTPVRVSTAPGETAYVELGAPLATGLHQVDNPAFDQHGNLYVTFSGSRGEQAPVSVFIVRPDGSREPFASGIANPTSMAFDSEGRLYVSSRFDATVHRIEPDGSVSTFATDLGVPCGIAFAPGGELYVGDRSGSILRVDGGRATLFASVPASVAAFHLAFGPGGWLYVTAPTLSSRDVVYRISPSGSVEVFCDGFGRPQGLAFDADGALYVVDAIAGDSAVYRLNVDRPGEKTRVLVGGALIGLAFDPRGGLALCSSETVYRLETTLRPFWATEEHGQTRKGQPRKNTEEHGPQKNRDEHETRRHGATRKNTEKQDS
jgi:sugar lactone lactonase YvrE